jgi:hypothetical protein
MKRKIVLYLIIVLYLPTAIIYYSCSPGKKTTATQNDPNQISGRDTVIVLSPGDGKSFETAVLIKETSESAGVHAEYQWIRNNYSGYKVAQQALVSHKRKPFDIITIQFNDNRKQDIYFDISKFYK